MIVPAYTPLIIRTWYLFQDILQQNFSDFLNANSVNPMKSQHWTIEKFDYLLISVQFSHSVKGGSTPLSDPNRRGSSKVSWPNSMSQKELPGESTGSVVTIPGLKSGVTICE